MDMLVMYLPHRDEHWIMDRDFDKVVWWFKRVISRIMYRSDMPERGEGSLGISGQGPWMTLHTPCMTHLGWTLIDPMYCDTNVMKPLKVCGVKTPFHHWLYMTKAGQSIFIHCVYTFNDQTLHSLVYHVYWLTYHCIIISSPTLIIEFCNRALNLDPSYTHVCTQRLTNSANLG